MTRIQLISSNDSTNVRARRQLRVAHVWWLTLGITLTRGVAAHPLLCSTFPSGENVPEYRPPNREKAVAVVDRYAFHRNSSLQEKCGGSLHQVSLLKIIIDEKTQPAPKGHKSERTYGTGMEESQP